jgi:hypothetical protein
VENVEGDDAEDHWRGGKNLRVRTDKVKPIKYSMVTSAIDREEETLEELTRRYGWGGDLDW